MKKMIPAGGSRNWPSKPGLRGCYKPGNPAANVCSQDDAVTSEAWEVPSYIGWHLFPVTLVGRLLCVPGHKNVRGNDAIYFATTMAHYSIL